MGWGEIIALFALIMSAVSLWQSNKDSAGFIIQGSGRVGVTEVPTEGCLFLMALPIEFNNSGKQSVALNRFKPTNLKPVLFSKDGKLLDQSIVKYEMYLTNSEYYGYSKLWLDSVRKAPMLNPENQLMIGQLIYPGKSYRSFIAVVANAYKDKLNVADEMLISFDVEFSNKQVMPIRAAISIAPYMSSQCNS